MQPSKNNVKATLMKLYSEEKNVTSKIKQKLMYQSLKNASPYHVAFVDFAN